MKKTLYINRRPGFPDSFLCSVLTFADSVISFSVVTFSGSVVTFACGEEAQDEEGLSSEDFF